MASVRISNPFPSTLNPPPAFNKPTRLLTARTAAAAADDDQPSQTTDEEKEKQPSPTTTTTTTTTTATDDQSFETRLAQVRLKYRSGTGKKAEKRKSKKSGTGTKKSSSSGTVMLPPVPLKEPVAAGGLKVDIGFTPYSEMINGRLAGLGLAALVLVELGSGKGLLSYHAPPILFVQVYTVTAAAALFIKLEKERISIWPEKAPAPAPTESSESSTN